MKRNTEQAQSSADIREWEKLTELAAALADTIRQTAAYNEYMAARERLSRDETNLQVLESLREQQEDLGELLSEGEDGRSRLLEELYMAISLNPVVSDYLNAEYKLDLMMGEVCKVFDDLFDFGEEEAPPGLRGYAN